MSTANSTENSSTNDILVPTDLDGDPLIWDGNNAKILGLLDACDKHYIRKGQFQPYFQHRAVLLSNGKIAVPSKATILFIMGELAITARRSPARTTIIFENPVDRSPGASIASAPDFARHGSIFRTTELPLSDSSPKPTSPARLPSPTAAWSLPARKSSYRIQL